MDDAPQLISMKDACRLTSLSPTSVKRYRSEGRFPQQVDIGFRRHAFVKSEVEQWINDRIAERGRSA